jgi:hypothetical protein
VPEVKMATRKARRSDHGASVMVEFRNRVLLGIILGQ